MNAISEIAKDIENRKDIRTFAKKNPDKTLDVVLKLQNARIELYEAIRLLLETGNA